MNIRRIFSFPIIITTKKSCFPLSHRKAFCIFWVVEVSIPTLPWHFVFLPWIAICSFLPPWAAEGSQLREEVKEEAKKILLTTDFSIHEVSSMIGYENTNHFINLFKKYVGSTPGKFRQKALEDRFSSHFPVQ
ncbi:MAG: helix-turn-helix domain-containing protein [Blautia sp.]|nr:helix-turn-helix domain-containing protein [Blautia sp.]NSY27114.1 helix-turn-helix domain-containing protein [Blautia sp. MSK.20.85]RGF80994.1 helix-turn-helix domain-containing protein [Ruminococcus sp. OF03-6AA]RGH51771.1 helix-turn-helix domain-containing protein [Ruminococcus sp. AM36-5]RGH58064.1 helix-turn-helix domain-containing protein [Ruminococcus sp. AM36-2AA]